MVWEENHSYGSVIGNDAAPELNFLANECGLATGYEALTHPSLPNYLEMTSGERYASAPWDTDCNPVGTCTTPAASVFSELDKVGSQWRSYAEAMVANCGHVSYDDYDVDHNPTVYYTSVDKQCDQWDQPLGTAKSGALHQALTTGPAASLTTVTPDVQDNMHSGTVAQADKWLAKWVPQILDSPAYRAGHLAVLIVWDEGSGSGDNTSHVPLIVMSASTPAGTRSPLRFNDFSVLQAMCELSGVAPLGEAVSAPSLLAPFHL